MAESETDPIRRTASAFLRENEQRAREIIAGRPLLSPEAALRAHFTRWSDWDCNNMATYLDMLAAA